MDRDGRRTASLGFGSHRRLQEEAGAVATEYGLLLALIALALVAALAALGLSVSDLFESGAGAFP